MKSASFDRRPIFLAQISSDLNMAPKSYRRIAARTSEIACDHCNVILPIGRSIFKTRHMKIRLFLLAGAASATIALLAAGTLGLRPKETAPPSITQSEPWQ